ncbi:sodium/hydrogen exchanger 3-like isoform 2-T2 [Clarias gariepinus]|uniref:sodium/hydrogen exchanger 3-like isoform X2 n=1 Tax=Clarias gariepinus TaxID=13013 RepID=UPI00234CC795|nr:sodium/hydrogen exchanger 3-like isoform X2 [Clarias gariepinus]
MLLDTMPRFTPVCLLAVVFLISSTPLAGGQTHNHGGTNLTHVPVVTLRWGHVETSYLVVLWILVAGVAKVSVIQMNTWLNSFFPESGLLIICGFILGGIVWGADKVQTFSLKPTNFFYFLLPPIILDTGYFMPNKLFFSNLGAILVHAVIGTVWNAATVGISLWACFLGGAMGDLEIGLLQFLLFGSLLAAVDPVAVIAVFEEVHVNEVLFIWVFGESLLNDAVTVVLYNVCDAFVSLGAARITAGEIIKGIVSFFVVAFGGAFVGVVFAVIISILTKYTVKVRVIEAGFIFVLGYLAYLTAEMLSLSSILSITFYGVCCQKYVNANMDEKSVTTVRYTMKVFAIGAETMIFVFLGLTAIDTVIWTWNTGFILLTLLFAIVYRFIGVFSLTWMLNRFRLVPMEIIDQIVMSYGGLRGAVAYGLAASLDETRIKEKNLILSTTLIVVYFTVILQGLTMKPLVKFLKVKRVVPSELKLIEKVNNRACEHILTAMEDISGRIGDNWWTRGWKRFEGTYITWFLLKPEARKNQDYLFSIFHKLNLEDAINYVTEGEKRGSLAFLRSDEGANVNFEKKKYGLEFSGVMPDITSTLDYGNGDMPMTAVIPNSIPSVSLSIHEQDMKDVNDDINAHHLLQQHLYRSRKNHRHRYSRSDFTINQNQDEVQEIFQRTMRSRLESFKSAKMGATPAKKITKHSKKDPTQKMSIGKPSESTTYPYGDEDFEFSEVESTSSGDGKAAGGSSPSRYATGGIENPAFMPDMDAPPPPWLTEAESDMSIAPSQRAQRPLPWSPSNLHRMAPLRFSDNSTDSFPMADTTPMEESHEEPFEEPPKKDGTHM